MLVEFTKHHCIKFRAAKLLLRREIFKKELLLLLYSELVGCITGELLLGKLVFGGNRLTELGNRLIIVLKRCICGIEQVSALGSTAIETHDAQITICIRSSADFLEETIIRAQII